MATATLGGLIKDYRIKKRLSQQEVSIRIGWRDTSRLSKIEQGRVGKPNRTTIEKVIRALDLNESEKGDFLLVGSYLPMDEEIQRLKIFCKDIIHKWEYPAYLIDFSWRVLDLNNLNYKLFRISESKEEFINHKYNLLELAFVSSDLIPITAIKADDQSSLTTTYQVAQIAKFKLEHTGMAKEKWYSKLVLGLMRYPQFRTLWKSVEIKDYDKKMLNYEFKVVNWADRNKTFKFHVFYSKIIQDSRFQTVLYLPADDFTREYWTSSAGIKS